MPKASFSWGAGEKGGLAVARRNGDRKAAARKLLNPKHSGHSWGTFEVDWPTASSNPQTIGDRSACGYQPQSRSRWLLE